MASWPADFVKDIDRFVADRNTAIATSGILEQMAVYFEQYPAGENAYNAMNWVIPGSPSQPFLSAVRARLVNRCKSLMGRHQTEELVGTVGVLVRWMGDCCLVCDLEGDLPGREVPEEKIVAHSYLIRMQLSVVITLLKTINELMPQSLPGNLYERILEITSAHLGPEDVAGRYQWLKSAGRELRALSDRLISMREASPQQDHQR